MPSDLFDKLAKLHSTRQEQQTGNAVVSVPVADAAEIGAALFDGLQSGGMCTHMVNGRTTWDPSSDYFDAARRAARRGCTIERLFLLPSRHLRHDEILRAHIRLDGAAGIATRMLDVSRLISRVDLTPDASLEFGVWDDAIASNAVYGSGAAAGAVDHWRISSKAADVASYTALAAALQDGAVDLEREPEPQPGTPEAVEEPVVETAVLARLAAPGLCHADPETGYDCASLHGNWQMFRLFDVVPTPQRNSGFFLDAFSKLAQDGDHERVFVSGTCDYSILAVLLHAYGNQNAPIDVTVSDLCETPLYLCKWYAKRMGQPIKTIASNILDCTADDPFDIVTTHSFLYNFSPEVRRQVVAKWHDLLRPGGRMITSARMSEHQAHQPMSWEPDQRKAFRQRIYEEARRWQGVLGLDPDEVADDADNYTSRPVVARYTLGGKDDFVALFEGTGFRVEHLELVDWGGNMSDKETGPGTNRKATYAEIVAVKI